MMNTSHRALQAQAKFSTAAQGCEHAAAEDKVRDSGACQRSGRKHIRHQELRPRHVGDPEIVTWPTAATEPTDRIQGAGGVSLQQTVRKQCHAQCTRTRHDCFWYPNHHMPGADNTLGREPCQSCH